ncbi:hypothetical protein C8J56DRAFT_1003869 [Mycena floridula]|nr:hypothetical protein C8J56DRAFT_1003869 [Mycena floridula]
MSTTGNPLPNALYENLLVKLVTILELTQKPEGISTPQAKQAVLQATTDFKNAVNQAKELAMDLPGGELLIEEQDQVIEMLKGLKERKREQLSQFSKRVVKSSASDKMEIDSMASTPMH